MSHSELIEILFFLCVFLQNICCHELKRNRDVCENFVIFVKIKNGSNKKEPNACSVTKTYMYFPTNYATERSVHQRNDIFVFGTFRNLRPMMMKIGGFWGPEKGGSPPFRESGEPPHKRGAPELQGRKGPNDEN